MRSTDPRRGAVLVTVLWSISLLAALAMAASVAFRSFTGVMTVDRHRVEREALITAGLELAAGTMLNSNTALRDVELSVNLTTGSVRVRLSDEGGRIDITKAPAEVIASLLRSVGAPPATADAAARAIVEQRGTSNPAPRSPVPVPAPVVATTHEQALSGIGRIVGMRAQWLGAIAPLTTIYGSDTVNPLTAPRGVIAALPGIDAAKVEAFLAERRNPSADASRLAQMLGPAARFVAEKPQRVAAVDLMATAGEGQPAAARAVITVLPRDSEPYRVLVFTPMPAAGLR